MLTLTLLNSIILVYACIISNLTALLDESQSKGLLQTAKIISDWLSASLQIPVNSFASSVWIHFRTTIVLIKKKKKKIKEEVEESSGLFPEILSCNESKLCYI